MRIYNRYVLRERRLDLRRHETPSEKVLWDHLRGRRFQGIKFFRQFSIGYFIVDFYSPKERLVIEIDGGHHLQRERAESDHERTLQIQSLDIVVLRFMNDEVLFQIDDVLEKIQSQIKRPPLPKGD